MKPLGLLVVAILLTSCTTRVRYEYFEPQGMGVTIRSPREAPPNVAQRRIGAAELSVWATVATTGRIEVSLRAEVSGGESLSFRGRTATVGIGDIEQPIPLYWTQRRIVDGRGASETLAFDAPLRGATFIGRPPQGGIQLLGRYECVITLPERFSRIDAFTLLLPAPEREDAPLRLAFTRKTADYRTVYQLQ